MTTNTNVYILGTWLSNIDMLPESLYFRSDKEAREELAENPGRYSLTAEVIPVKPEVGGIYFDGAN